MSIASLWRVSRTDESGSLSELAVSGGKSFSEFMTRTFLEKSHLGFVQCGRCATRTAMGELEAAKGFPLGIVQSAFIPIMATQRRKRDLNQGTICGHLAVRLSLTSDAFRTLTSLLSIAARK
jgi:hypothetical protein